jgi:predicted acyltransferase
MSNRSYALDALRGIAIVLMVLSGSIAFGILPEWMYHAQTPPPTHVFNPDVPGITWVDLVFPFFLFAMGAAFPFSIKGKIEKGESKLKLVYDALKRGAQLTFFAIFIQHFYPWIISSPQDTRAWLLSLSCFLLLFPMFMRIPYEIPNYVRVIIKLSAYVAAFILLNTITYANDRKFDPHFSNIIILVLANMALFGTLIYIFTAKNRLARIVILPFIMAVFLGSKIDGSITKAIFDFTPLSWFYKFNYLKYLFIIIPGSIAGEYLYDWMQTRKNEMPMEKKSGEKISSVILLVISILVIIGNVWLLFERFLVVNLLVTAVLLVIGYFVLRKDNSTTIILWRKLFIAGGYLLLLGLFFEAFEGGIKKDHSTYSYYFVTSGLAFIGLIALNIICDYYKCLKSTQFIIMSGQNPMIAYVCTGLFSIPMLSLLKIYPLFHHSGHPWLGFLQGVVMTSIAVLVTMFFTRIKWFWRS